MKRKDREEHRNKWNLDVKLGRALKSTPATAAAVVNREANCWDEKGTFTHS